MQWLRRLIIGDEAAAAPPQEAAAAEPAQQEEAAAPAELSSEELEQLRQRRIQRFAAPSSSKTPPKTPPPKTPPQRPVVAASAAAVAPAAAMAAAAWIEELLERCIGVSVWSASSSAAAAAEIGGDGTVRLTQLAEECPPPTDAAEFTTELADRIVVARLSSRTQGAPCHADFLAECFARLSAESRRHPPRGAASSDHAAVVATLRRLVVSYLGIVLQFPDVFPAPNPSPSVIEAAHEGPARLLLYLAPASSDDWSGPEELLRAIVERFAEDGLDALVPPVVQTLVAKAARVASDAEFLPLVRTLALLVQFPQIASVVIAMPLWLGSGGGNAADGRTLETRSVLGPFFSFTPLTLSVPLRTSMWKAYFPKPLESPPGQVDASQRSLRMCIQAVQREMMGVLRSVIKSSPEGREAVLAWLAAVLNANASRTKINYDRNTTSSHGFLLNIASVMLDLVSPLTERTLQAAAIDPTYLLASSRLKLDQETKLAATSSEVNTWWVDPRNASRQQNWKQKEGSGLTVTPTASPSQHAPADAPKPNFASEVFFICMRFFHLAYSRTLQDYYQLNGRLQNQEFARRSLLERKSVWALTPQAAQNEAQLEQLKNEVGVLLQAKLCFDSHLADDQFLDKAGKFFSLFARWSLNIVSPEGPRVPLPTTVPMEFAALPEFVVEDLATYVQFTAQVNPLLLPIASLGGILDFLVCFFCSPDHIRSPFLRAKLVEAIGQLVPKDDKRFGVMRVDPIASHDLSARFLVPALFRFFVDVELTGSHTQFYDKFNWRLGVQRLLRHLWSLPGFKKAIVEFLTSEDPELVGTVDKVALYTVSDTNYQLDESLSKLAEIRAIQQEMNDLARWQSIRPDDRAEAESRLQGAERFVVSFMRSSNSNIETLHMLATAVPTAFLRSKEVSRAVAGMLNYFLAQIAGPRALSLKVDNPEKYHFRPRELLSFIAETYVALCPSRRFVKALARDTRSYSDETLSAAAGVLERTRLIRDDALAAFLDMARRAREICEADKQAEEALGDIPDEFCDPLMQTLMRDPVTLPASNMVVDRSTIIRHLLSDPTDPFTRAPLKIEDVVTNDELREKINAWVASRSSSSK